jgi:uncharacterized repeat protein (TIGR01451 family)
MTVRNSTPQVFGGVGAASVSSIFVENTSVVTDNNPADFGDGIALSGTGSVTVTNSTVTNKRAGGDRGGIAPRGGGDITITNSTVSGNSQTSNAALTGGDDIAQDSTCKVAITGGEIADNSAVGDVGSLLNTSAAKLTISLILSITTRPATEQRRAQPPDHYRLLHPYQRHHQRQQRPAQRRHPQRQRWRRYPPERHHCFRLGHHDRRWLLFFRRRLPDVHQYPLANNTASMVGGYPDVDTTTASDLVDSGNNLIGDNTGAAGSFIAGTANAQGSFVGTSATPLEALLEERLEDNGGTVVLPDGSHLLTHQDKASNGNNGVRDRGVGGLETRAERGFPRHIDAQADIGAIDFQDFDLAVHTSAPAGTIRAGLPATFTLAVTNNGPNPAHAVTVTDILDILGGAAIVSVSGSFTVNGNRVTFAVPDLTAGARTSFTLTVISLAPGPFREDAIVSTHDEPRGGEQLGLSQPGDAAAALPDPTGSADVTAQVQIVQQGRRSPRGGCSC